MAATEGGNIAANWEKKTPTDVLPENERELIALIHTAKRPDELIEAGINLLDHPNLLEP